jgi:hypothetical protein
VLARATVFSEALAAVVSVLDGLSRRAALNIITILPRNCSLMRIKMFAGGATIPFRIFESEPILHLSLPSFPDTSYLNSSHFFPWPIEQERLYAQVLAAPVA